MEAKLKHLDFIQSAIGRMATNSFLFKGWAITIATGLSAFGAANTKVALLVIALVTTLLFWGLDGYYLWLERGFVALHKSVAAKAESEIDFSMAVDKSQAAQRWFATCWRPHLWLFYGGMIAIDVVGIFVLKKG
jgi:hypothetical protein